MSKQKSFWLVYSYEPSTKVPGGRKHRVEETVEATDRKGAKSTFLELHPEELAFGLGASRTVTGFPLETQELETETNLSVSPGVVAVSKTPRHSKKMLKTDPIKAVIVHPLFGQVENAFEIIKDKTANYTDRQFQLQWLSGVKSVDADSALSRYVQTHLSGLRELLYNDSPDDAAKKD